MRTYSIAVIPGDGIGKEVVPAALHCVRAAEQRFGFRVECCEYDWSCERYLHTGEMMPADGLGSLAQHEAIFLGAVGYPGVADHTSLWGLLLPIRREFDQYVNFRPATLLRGVSSPLRIVPAGGIDLIVVRENTEGEYSNIGGVAYAGSEREVAIQQAVFSRHATDRILRAAFETALRQRRRRVTLATKSNGLPVSMPFWDARFARMSLEYPTIQADKRHIDALVAALVRSPGDYDVLVGSNLFGDILSDLCAALVGGLGVAASANLNPERRYPSMFEAVHGSAPDIAGKGIANPVAQILSAVLMLRHLGEEEAAAAMELAVHTALLSCATTTPDLGGTATTHAVAECVTQFLRHH